MPEDIYCKTCLLKRGHPGISFDEQGVCSSCNREVPEHLMDNFRMAEKNAEEYEKSRADTRGDYDCVLMLSGGKDSIYMLHKTVYEHKKNPLVYTFINPFESEHGIRNIERNLDVLEVDHIAFTSHVKYKKLAKYFFPEFKNKESAQYLDEKLPCRICSAFVILSAFWLAYRWRIPYILYCADPMQIVTMPPTIKHAVKALIDFVERDVLVDVFGDRLDFILNADNNECPRIIYPFVTMYFDYNPDKIIAELKARNLYESSPMATHCALFPLLNYYSYKKFGCFYYAHDYAKRIRDLGIPRDLVLKLENQYKDVLFNIVVKKEINELEKKKIKEFLNKMCMGDEAGAKYLYDIHINTRKIAAEIGFDWD